mmetsp:Transcript_11818/g.33367  ORF Transcript_11818/g.33367 Transcript_11818/m.33367 type:complete len:474 (-) Transcript_11818:4143-5564(-)
MQLAGADQRGSVNADLHHGSVDQGLGGGDSDGLAVREHGGGVATRRGRGVHAAQGPDVVQVRLVRGGSAPDVHVPGLGVGGAAGLKAAGASGHVAVRGEQLAPRGPRLGKGGGGGLIDRDDSDAYGVLHRGAGQEGHQVLAARAVKPRRADGPHARARGGLIDGDHNVVRVVVHDGVFEAVAEGEAHSGRHPGLRLGDCHDLDVRLVSQAGMDLHLDVVLQHVPVAGGDLRLVGAGNHGLTHDLKHVSTVVGGERVGGVARPGQPLGVHQVHGRARDQHRVHRHAVRDGVSLIEVLPLVLGQPQAEVALALADVVKAALVKGLQVEHDGFVVPCHHVAARADDAVSRARDADAKAGAVEGSARLEGKAALGGVDDSGDAVWHVGRGTRACRPTECHQLQRAWVVVEGHVHHNILHVQELGAEPLGGNFLGRKGSLPHSGLINLPGKAVSDVEGMTVHVLVHFADCGRGGSAGK